MNAPTYFEKWVHSSGQPIRPLKLEDAQARHLRSAPYVAVLDAVDGKRVVDVAGDWVSVLFMDAANRLFLKYDFKRLEAGRLFLTLASHYDYGEGSTKPRTAITFAFKPDGLTLIEKRDISTGQVEEKESRGDPRANWEDYPQFGQYGLICRLDRA